MAFSSDDNDFGTMAEINVVPLVDVMLVLLIISMITTPLMEQGVNVELPVAQGQSLEKTQSEEPVVLFLSRDRNLRLGETPVSRGDLAEMLEQTFKNRAQKELFVRADKEVPYGAVAEIMTKVQAAGIDRVGLVTQPE